MPKQCRTDRKNNDLPTAGCGCGSGGGHKNGGGKRRIVQLGIGALLLGAALIIGERGGVQPYIFLASYAILGWRVVYTAVKNIFRGKFFDECFLMTAATGVSLLATLNSVRTLSLNSLKTLSTAPPWDTPPHTP